MTRPAVAWFAEAMEQKLQANDHKPDWSGSDTQHLVHRLLEEVLELHQACVVTEVQAPEMKQMCVSEIVREAADVANFAMMIADKASGLFAQRGRQTR